ASDQTVRSSLGRLPFHRRQPARAPPPRASRAKVEGSGTAGGAAGVTTKLSRRSGCWPGAETSTRKRAIGAEKPDKAVWKATLARIIHTALAACPDYQKWPNLAVWARSGRSMNNPG